MPTDPTETFQRIPDYQVLVDASGNTSELLEMDRTVGAGLRAFLESLDVDATKFLTSAEYKVDLDDLLALKAGLDDLLALKAGLDDLLAIEAGLVDSATIFVDGVEGTVTKDGRQLNLVVNTPPRRVFYSEGHVAGENLLDVNSTVPDLTPGYIYKDDDGTNITMTNFPSPEFDSTKVAYSSSTGELTILPSSRPRTFIISGGLGLLTVGTPLNIDVGIHGGEYSFRQHFTDYTTGCPISVTWPLHVPAGEQPVLTFNLYPTSPNFNLNDGTNLVPRHRGNTPATAWRIVGFKLSIFEVTL